MDDLLEKFAEAIAAKIDYDRMAVTIAAKLEGSKKPDDMLTSDEAAEYLGITKSNLYKLTSSREIPFYKPGGKTCYFKREDLDAYKCSNRVSSDAEIRMKAQAYCMNNKFPGSRTAPAGRKRTQP